jgi:GTPase
MLYRLYEGDGKAVYLIGVRDNGISIGINTEELFETLHPWKFKMEQKIPKKIFKVCSFQNV